MKKQSRSGFTLFELLVATAIAVIFISGLFLIRTRFLTPVSGALKILSAQARVNRFFDTCSRDFISCFQTKELRALQRAPGPFAGTRDSVTFFSLNSGLAGLLWRGNGGLFRVRYHLVKNPEATGGYSVLREVRTAFEHNDTEPREEVVLDAVSKAVFEYYDGGRWIPEYSGETVPYGVKVTVVLNGDSAEQYPYTRILSIPAGTSGPSNGKKKEEKE